jgi:hypothetical protein
MGVNKTAAQIRARREEWIAKGAAEERQRSESEEAKATEEKQRAECTKERDSAYESINRDQAEYDKQLLTLSAGFLVLSLAFIKDVVPLNHAAHLWALYLAFILIGICVCLVLVSFQYSIHIHISVGSYWQHRNDVPSGGKQTGRKRFQVGLRRLLRRIKRDGKRIRCLNWSSGVLFIAGVAFLVWFVISNISRQALMSSLENKSVMPPIHIEQPAHRNDSPKPELPQGGTSKVPLTPQPNPKS